MRPKIPDRLAERVETAVDEHGYATSAELVREAVRLRLETLDE